MNISKNWLEKFLPEIDKYEDKLISERLTASLTEVENVKIFGKNIKKLISGKILKVKKHKNAKKLSICTVDIGTEKKQIICGAPNVEINSIVIVCLAGGQVINPKNQKIVKIENTKIRGIESEGMICSEKELGISDNHKEIVILPQSTKIGTEIDDLIFDSIFEIENKSLTHRGDCFSHLGIARELSVILNTPFINLEEQINPIPTEILPIEVSIETKKCKKFCVISLKDIQVKESPFWLKLELLRIGERPINNIVDVTNYIMYHLGQPLHAYDYQKIKENKLTIREARTGEKFTAINHNEYVLNQGDIVISDSEKIQDLAGIIGGTSSEISSDTKEIILEAAAFDTTQILKTTRRLGIRTEAGIRNSKGVDMDNTINALKQATMMIQDIAGGEIGSEILDLYPEPKKKKTITVDLTKVNSFIGAEIDYKEILIALEKIGLNCINKQNLNIEKNMIGVPVNAEFEVPSWRYDLNISVDIIEEIARIYGYDKITPSLPQKNLKAMQLDANAKLIRNTRKYMLRLGFDELMTYSFISEELKELFQIKTRHLLKITNAISPELKYVRNSLIPSLTNAFSKNFKAYEQQNLFEIGRVIDIFEKLSIKEANLKPGNNTIPKQNWTLGLLSSENLNDIKTIKEKINFSEKFYLQIKGKVEILLNELGIDPLKRKWEQSNKKNIPFIYESLHPQRQSILMINNIIVGFIGEVHPLIIHKLTQENFRIVCAQIDLSKLLNNRLLSKKIFTNISSFPEVKRDICFVLKKNTKIGDIDKFITSYQTNDKNILIKAKLIDEYYHEKDNQRTATFSFTIKPYDKTLTDKQANKIIKTLTNQICNQFNLDIRE